MVCVLDLRRREASLQKVAKDLVALAQEKGTKDDVTVLIARL
jgi:serine/threonine protein phosphatase PrpC